MIFFAIYIAVAALWAFLVSLRHDEVAPLGLLVCVIVWPISLAALAGEHLRAKRHEQERDAL